MHGFSLVVLLTIAQMPSIQVASLSGEQHNGSLEKLDSNVVVVKVDGQSVSIPLAEVLSIQSATTTTTENQAPIEIRLIDNTLLRVQSFTSTATVASVDHRELGKLQFPVSSIANIRFAAPDAKVDAEWAQLVDRSIKKDAVAVRKGDVLDHLDGVIGSLNETTMQFQMDGDEIPVKREKLFGLIFSKRESTAKRAVAQLKLATGDRLAIKQIAWTGTAWKARLASGLDLDVAVSLFQMLDFSSGKVTYLSDLEPRNVKLTPFFGIQTSFPVNEFRRDKNFDGLPITLGDKPYPKGLAIHSQTLLMYRLGGEYRRFQAVMGIGDEVPRGDVDVVLKGDGKVLFKSAVKATDTDGKDIVHRLPPQTLDIDVTGVVEFEIFVDFGSDKWDIGDRLYLANARAIK